MLPAVDIELIDKVIMLIDEDIDIFRDTFRGIVYLRRAVKSHLSPRRFGL